MIIKVISTTDNKLEGTTFEVSEISLKEINTVLGKTFTYIVIAKNMVKVQNSNYTINFKIINDG